MQCLFGLKNEQDGKRKYFKTNGRKRQNHQEEVSVDSVEKYAYFLRLTIFTVFVRTRSFRVSLWRDEDSRVAYMEAKFTL